MSPRLHFATFVSLVVAMFAVPAVVMYLAVEVLGKADYAEAAPYGFGIFALLFSSVFALTILVRASCPSCGRAEMRFEGFSGGIQYRCASCAHVFDTGWLGRFLSSGD